MTKRSELEYHYVHNETFPLVLMRSFEDTRLAFTSWIRLGSVPGTLLSLPAISSSQAPRTAQTALLRLKMCGDGNGGDSGCARYGALAVLSGIYGSPSEPFRTVSAAGSLLFYNEDDRQSSVATHVKFTPDVGAPTQITGGFHVCI